jgi:trehalose utilization protein
MSESGHPIRVTVWNENYHETTQPEVKELYPEGIHGAVAAGIGEHLGDRASTRTATLQEPEHGLTEQVLDETDVLVWWGHAKHADVADEIVERVHARVLGGMGLIVLHSGHFSKIFIRLLGTTCSLDWRDDGDREVIWTVAPGHPITEGLPNPFVIPEEETYGEYFDIPEPEELVFISSFAGGEVFRSGATFRRGQGRIFYFRPGDQNYPTYQRAEVRRVIANAVAWAAPDAASRKTPGVRHTQSGWFAEGGA